LRETSVIFAALIGMIWLGERPITPRLIAAAIVCGGIILLGISPE
jgi:drug/metabolite transporter (DMT)-like permease